MFGGVGGQNAQSFNMSGGTPFQERRGEDRSGSKLVLDLKLARIDNHLYSDSRPETWHTHVRSYLVGRHDDMGTFLDWIENRGNQVITYDDLRHLSSEHSGGDGLMMSMDPIGASKELWSWLNLSLEKSTKAQQTFRSVAELNGAEVYRKLVVPLGKSKPSVTRRGRLRDRVQQPSRAKSMVTIMDAVGDWEEDEMTYMRAGGRAQDDEERREQLIKILPSGISDDMLSRAADCPSADGLIDWMREKSLFLSEHKSASAHVAEVPPPPMTP